MPQNVLSRITAKEVAQLTYDLVAIRSETGHEEEASRFYCDYLNGIGIPARLQTVQNERANVIGELKGAGDGPNLLLFGHIDTIPWGICVPASVDEHVVWGRGSTDMKCSLAAIAIAAKAIKEAGVKLKGTVWLAAGVGHEFSWPVSVGSFSHGDGPRAVAKSIADGEMKVDYCVVTEGPKLKSVKTVQGGQAGFRITVSGGPGAVHTTTTTIEHSPAVWAGDVLAELFRYCKEIEQRPLHPLIPLAPRLEIGMVSGGDFFNRNLAKVEIVGCIRWNPDWSIEQVRGDFDGRLKELRGVLAKKYGDESIRLSLEFIVVRDACDAAENPRTLELAERINRVAEPILGKMNPLAGSRSVDDIAVFYKEAGLPTVSYGPTYIDEKGAVPEGVHPGYAHSDNEGQPIEYIYKIAQVYAALMMDVCGVAE